MVCHFSFQTIFYFTPEPDYVAWTKKASSILLEDESLVQMYSQTQEDNQQSPSLISAFVLLSIGAYESLWNVSATLKPWVSETKVWGNSSARPRGRLKAEANSYWSQDGQRRRLAEAEEKPVFHQLQWWGQMTFLMIVHFKVLPLRAGSKTVEETQVKYMSDISISIDRFRMKDCGISAKEFQLFGVDYL